MRHLSLVIAMATAGLLVACGGSPSSSSTPAPGGGGGTTLTLNGVAAKGAALASATVTATCAAGTATPVTASATGAYTLTIPDGALPCVLEATGTGADASLVLHSVATGSGSTATSNITPVTELLVAQLTGQDPADFMDAANASTLATTVTTSGIDAAKTAVIATLSAAGLDTSALASADMVSGTLAAGTGNGYDGVLDALGTALAGSGTTLAQLTETVATTSPANTSGGGQAGGETAPPVSLLPANLLLRPAASNCAALRSTNYRLVKVTRSAVADDTSPFTPIEMATVDATALTLTFAPGDVLTLTPNGNCRYTFDGGDVAVSPSGVMVMRAFIDADDDTVNTTHRNANRLIVGLPVQQLALADLAGDWNFLGLEEGSGSYGGLGGGLTISAAGAVSNDRCFEDPLGTTAANCTASTDPAPTFAVHADGAFTLGLSLPGDTWVDRVFAYKGGSGAVMLLVINNLGEVMFGTKARALPLPAVGDTTTNITFLADRNLVANDAVQSHTNTIASVNAETGVVVRNSFITGSTVSHPQTLRYAAPRTGYLQRDGGQAVGSDGSNWSVRHFEGLPMNGMGFTVLYMPSTVNAPANNARFALSVRQ